MNAELRHNFNVLLSKNDFTMVTQLAHALSLSRGTIIRQLIAWRHASTFGVRLICTDGHPCPYPRPAPPLIFPIQPPLPVDLVADGRPINEKPA